MTEIWTPPRLVQWIKGDLQTRGFSGNHRFEAESLVSHALGISRLDLYLQFDKPCSPEERQQVRELYKKRLEHVPLGYLVGRVGFWSLELQVGPGVLIPRPDSEILVEACAKLLPKTAGESFRTLELGAGTLALSLALAMEGKGMEMYATEVSPQALSYAQQNLQQYQKELAQQSNQLQLVQCEGFALIPEHPPFHLIFSNPPYIPRDIIPTLEPEVSQHEPRLALDGGLDGLDFYRLLSKEAARLYPGGHLAVEHGYDQRDQLIELFSQNPLLQLCAQFDDHGQNPRVLLFERKQ